MSGMLVACLLATGILVGLSAGLFGIGGGVVAIPIYILLFQNAGIPPDHVVHVAFATNLFTVIFNATVSSRTHWRKGRVVLSAGIWMGLGSIAGGLLGAKIATLISGECLKSVFALLVFYSAYRILPVHEKTGTAAVSNQGRKKHSSSLFLLAGVLTGVVSGITGLGGAVVSIPLMIMLFRIPARFLAGTASMVMVFTSLSATAGYILAGWQTVGHPPGMFGYVYLPAGVVVLITSLLFSFLGAKLNQKLRQQSIRWLFATFLFVMAGKMLFF